MTSTNPGNALQLSIVIPVYNEEAVLRDNVEAIIKQLKEHQLENWELLIVENGSKDRTREIGAELQQEHAGVRLMSMPEPGYGKAMKAGLLEARGEVIVNFDIDYWDVDFVQVAVCVMRVKYDILIASKNLLLSKDQRGWIRKVASYVFRMLLFFVFGLRVSDTHGIKAWRNTEKMRSLIEKSAPSHHTFDTEVIIRAMHDRHEVLEVPVEVIETRDSDRHILKRVPQALQEIFNMYTRLRQERG